MLNGTILPERNEEVTWEGRWKGSMVIKIDAENHLVDGIGGQRAGRKFGIQGSHPPPGQNWSNSGDCSG
jgi:hypothetical protein